MQVPKDRKRGLAWDSLVRGDLDTDRREQVEAALHSSRERNLLFGCIATVPSIRHDPELVVWSLGSQLNVHTTVQFLLHQQLGVECFMPSTVSIL
jgi:hypothetical protein